MRELILLIREAFTLHYFLTAMAICTPVGTWPCQHSASIGLGLGPLPLLFPSSPCPFLIDPTIWFLVSPPIFVPQVYSVGLSSLLNLLFLIYDQPILIFCFQLLLLYQDL